MLLHLELLWPMLIFGPFPAQLLAKRSPVDPWQPRFLPDNATGGPIQPALLRAAQLAANEGGSVMLTVRPRRCKPQGCSSEIRHQQSCSH